MAKNSKLSSGEVKELLTRLKPGIPSSSDAFAALGLEEGRAFRVLRSEGIQKKYAFAGSHWSDENPSSGYCYRLTGTVYVKLADEEQKFTPDEMMVMKLKKTINGRNYDHYYLVFCRGGKKEDAVLIDLTRDQIDNDDVHTTIQEYPYEEAVIADGRTMRNMRNGRDQTEFHTKFWEQYEQEEQ